jgi:hypothetical protein
MTTAISEYDTARFGHLLRGNVQEYMAQEQFRGSPAMNPGTQDTFADMIDQFLARYCQRGTGFHVWDRQLFAQFRTYWISLTAQSAHPALLGQYHVELTERGYRSRGGKRPHWYGLSLQIE